jgi:hypothetical protein
LLEERGTHLTFPYSSGVTGSRHSSMRELRVQHRGRPYRVLYIFDPRRVPLLLLGGDKTGDDRWYAKNVPLADQLYDSYLAEIEEEDNAKDHKIQSSPSRRALPPKKSRNSTRRSFWASFTRFSATTFVIAPNSATV